MRGLKEAQGSLRQQLQEEEAELRQVGQEVCVLVMGAREARLLMAGGMVVPPMERTDGKPEGASPVDGSAAATPSSGLPAQQAAEPFCGQVPLGEALAQTARERALEIVRDTRITAGIASTALVRQLELEKHAVYGRQVCGWLGEWAKARLVRQLHDGSYIRAGTPCAPATAGIPEPLGSAHAAAVGAGGVIATQDLPTALWAEYPHPNPSALGQQLVALLRDVGITRPNQGKIPSRNDGATVLGFTARHPRPSHRRL
ncbi:hypothetical protein [Streptomyces jumonjinensis]|uniref:hypothetical protein n=1 Tax=Streptomyces jumonjinensis TaxID=1945 RepID=UPI0037B3669C